MLILFLILGCQKQVKESEELTSISVEKKQEILEIIYKQPKINLCNQQQDKDLSKDSANISTLNNELYLVEILCFLGAYQSNYQYILFDKNSKHIKIINFDTFENSTDNLKLTNTNTLTGTTKFDPSTQILIIETKTRGLGDCGSFAKYQWKNNQFELQEYRYKPNCDEVYISPENYPLIYP